MYRILKEKRIDIFFIIVFFILPFIFFRDSLNLNNVILGNEDAVRYYIPVRLLITNLIKEGQFPFWNQFIFGGFPLLSEPAAHVFYPLIFILCFFYL